MEESSEEMDKIRQNNKTIMDIWEEELAESIELVLDLADSCKGKDIDPKDIINEFIKIHDKKPVLRFKHNVTKLIIKYTCKIRDIDPSSIEGLTIARAMHGPCSAEEEQERNRYLEEKEKIRKGLKPGYMPFYLKQYAEVYPERNIYYTF